MGEGLNPSAAPAYEISIVRAPMGWCWGCTCGSLGGGWPNRDLALDEAEAHLSKHEEVEGLE